MSANNVLGSLYSVADGPLTTSWPQKRNVSYHGVQMRPFVLNSIHKYGGAKT